MTTKRVDEATRRAMKLFLTVGRRHEHTLDPATLTHDSEAFVSLRDIAKLIRQTEARVRRNDSLRTRLHAAEAQLAARNGGS